MKFHVPVQCIWKQKYFNWIVFDGIFFFFQWGQKVVQKHESESSKYRIKTFQVGQVKYSTVDLKEDYLKLQISTQILLNIFYDN